MRLSDRLTFCRREQALFRRAGCSVFGAQRKRVTRRKLRGKSPLSIQTAFNRARDFPEAEAHRCAPQDGVKALPHKAISLHVIASAANFRVSYCLDDRPRTCCTKSTKVI
ncbi:hypothetical protein BJG93_35620 [Paraburkholderia sprentiae WSM5005]|uniref:Uncharacterized protein n=1 Tax=Paraburkholderia sprentiae WSM5005 TaxID=754502 RepID=A0A8F4KI37_9BURK|nr:hypothetical protein [Paraburkholderia sprentiae]QXE07289.1 hypothetical protein BJG93_35620 [Paraburkholderia sprentiae WSM5005]